jgi:hypothetical protein
LNKGAAMATRIRRTLARALSIDEDEKRALIERILPRGEGGQRELRLESDADRQQALLAIVAAVSADAITGDEAEELRRRVESGEASKQAEETRENAKRVEWNAQFLRGMVEGPRKYWGIEPDEEFVRSVNKHLAEMGKEPVPLARRSAAEESDGLANINENASGEARRGAEEPSA